MIVIFWIALLLPLYSYVFYPLLIVVMGAIARRLRRPRRSPDPELVLPPVAFVVSAYNEERHVAELVSNLGALDYPASVTLYLGSDGSSDRTAEILQSYAGSRVRVFPFPENRGKASVLNDLLTAVVEPIVVFTDANTCIEPKALQRLVRHFDDSRVGCVCGELVLRTTTQGDNVDGIYWRIERLLKASENAFGALLGANGGIYAIRRQCYVPIRPDTVIDDFCIAMTVAASGWLLVYEPAARAVEDAPPQMRHEFKRRVRIGIGNYQAFFRHPEFLLRTGAMTGFAYVSHKVLRWFTPHLLLVLLLMSVLLINQSLYRGLFFMQLTGYALCLILYWLSPRVALPRLLRLPVFLLAMNVAFGVGFYRYVSGRYSGSWKRTARA